MPPPPIAMPPRMPLPPAAAPPRPPATNVAKILTVTPHPPALIPPPVIPAPMMPNPFMPPAVIPMMHQAPSYGQDDGPSAKRARFEEDLEPEELWLRKVQGQISLNIQTPPTDEWNLKGKSFNISLDITSPVSFIEFYLNSKMLIITFYRSWVIIYYLASQPP